MSYLFFVQSYFVEFVRIKLHFPQKSPFVIASETLFALSVVVRSVQP